MIKKTHEELKEALEIAAEKVEVGGLYAHFKTPNDPSHAYIVKGFGILQTTNEDEVGVLYEAQYGKNILFIRPLSSWLETPEWNGLKVPRFQKIN